MEIRQEKIKGLYFIKLMTLISIAGCNFFRIYSYSNYKIHAKTYLYMNIIVPISMVISIMIGFIILIKNFRNLNRNQKSFLVFCMLILTIFCPINEGIKSIKDLRQGTKNICTTYYMINQKFYVYDENLGSDISPIVNKKQYHEISTRYPDLKQSQTFDLEEWWKMTEHIHPVYLEYYPNTLLVSYIEYRNCNKF